MLGSLLLTLPWIATGAFLAFGIRFPRPLPPAPLRDGPEHPVPDGPASAGISRAPTPQEPAGSPLVSVIVPARNEEHNILRCLEGLTAQQGVRVEVLVVDDRSDDRTAELARSVPPGRAERVEVITGRELPPGWFGKPWACQQGAEAARGEILLFTDADTVHGPDLLARSVAGLREDGADVLSLVGRQLMETFWEKVVQPQVFTLIGMRFPRLDRPVEGRRWAHAVANGQYLLVTRQAYDAVGGHEAVKGEVVEDVRLAQELTRGGFRLTVRGAEDALATRMYRNLGELVQGWMKNMYTGATQLAPPHLRRVAIPLILLILLGLWVAPPLVLVGALAGGGSPGVLAWAGTATGAGLAIWSAGSVRMGASAIYGLFYPLGAATAALILARSWLRGGRRIEWKGRRYAPGRP